MYVCLCNAVTESDVSQAMEEGANTLGDLKKCLGVATGCGQCAVVACDMLKGRQNLCTMPAEPPAANPSAHRVTR